MVSGKDFEARFKKNWNETVPDSFCYRLVDVMSGYKSVKNVSDFINYKYPLVYIIDCKAHAKNTISFSDFSQFDEMSLFQDIPGVVSGTVVFFYDHDLVCFIPIKTWVKLKEDDKKSFNVKYLESGEYDAYVIPSKKLRTFMNTDYLAFTKYCEEKYGRQ